MRLKRCSLLLLLLFLATPGCRGWTSESPPVLLNRNMATQAKYKPYRASEWFSDGRAMRPLEEGVVARGHLDADELYYAGKINGEPTREYPPEVRVNKEIVERGRVMFNRSCSHCHGMDGSGTGLVGRRLPVKPPTFHSDYLRGLPVGHFFDVVRHGIRTMQAPAQPLSISIEDSWAIVSYIRALQLSQDAGGNWLKREASSKGLPTLVQSSGNSDHAAPIKKEEG
jgi:mono/diheme cytochrome c family protein